MGKAGVNICAHARTHMHVSQESQGGEKKSLLNPTFCNDDILQNVFKSREVRLHNTLTQMVGFTSVPSISPLTSSTFECLSLNEMFLFVYSSQLIKILSCFRPRGNSLELPF